jgi:glycosyltransferase involved in cell wall biosynthesis
VGSIGWLTPIKGYRYFVEALALLKPRYPTLYGVIVGSGELRQELKHLAASLGIEGSLRLLGKRDDVPECLAAMDLFVLPSLNEGMGRALVEAMATGLPVIGTKVGGIPALIDHEVNGLLVPPADSEALAEALRSLIDRPELAKRLGDAAHRSVGEQFSASSMVRAIDGLYEETLREVGAW